MVELKSYTAIFRNSLCGRIQIVHHKLCTSEPLRVVADTFRLIKMTQMKEKLLCSLSSHWSTAAVDTACMAYDAMNKIKKLMITPSQNIVQTLLVAFLVDLGIFIFTMTNIADAF